MTMRPLFNAALLAFGLAAAPAFAQDAAEIEPAEAAPTDVTLLFDTGRASVSPDQQRQLDQAARVFRDGNPVIMTVTGTADTVGNPEANLDLSIRRARAVADGLVERGIPIERLQVLGQGNSELPVTTDDEVANEENRSVTITWR